MQYLFAEMATDQIADHAQKYTDDPLFLYMAFSAPHIPLQAPSELIELVSNWITVIIHEYILIFYKHLLVPKERQWNKSYVWEACILCNGQRLGHCNWADCEKIEAGGIVWEQHHLIFIRCEDEVLCGTQNTYIAYKILFFRMEA